MKNKKFQVFDSLSWTEAQKRGALQYRSGMAIRFHRGKGVFDKNETLQVVAVENDTLKVQRAGGSDSILQLGQGCALSASFDVGENRTLKVATGDKLLLQANAVAGRKHFVNGKLVEVKAMQGGTLVLADGWIISENYRAFTHGYAVRSHGAQGMTVDEVLVVASSRLSPAVHQEQFYVSISRGREHCQIFTDDADLLRSHVTRSSARLAAAEAVPYRAFGQSIWQRSYQFLKKAPATPGATPIPFSPQGHQPSTNAST